MSWFTELEEVAYSVVEYIPLVGTVYSLKRGMIAYREHDWVTHWQSMANFLESSIRDIVLLGEIAEPTYAAILHTMAESFTDKVIEIYHREPKKPEVKVSSRLDKDKGHVLVAESSMGRNKSLIFEGKAKGVHHFHRAAFTGTLTHPKYAPNGEKIRLDIRQGLYDGAQVTFSWKWTRDWFGNPNSPEVTLGTVQLLAGKPTRFRLSKYKGVGPKGGWEGYDFSGQIKSKDQIIAKTIVGGQEIQIDFRRVDGT